MITAQMKEVLTHYNKGLELYKSRQFQEAMNSFKKGLEIIPDDGPTLMYIKRCKEFIENPPPADWNGVYIMKTK